MRINPALLLVIVAFTVPIVVEARTMLVWIGIELSILQTVVVGVLAVGAILAWAFWPEADDEGNATETDHTVERPSD